MSETTTDSGPEDSDGHVTTEDVVAVFKHHESPAITSRDVSVVLGCSRDVARQRLRSLADAGEVKRHKSGTVVLWWHPDHVDEPTVSGDLEPIEATETNSVEDIEANPQPDTE